MMKISQMDIAQMLHKDGRIGNILKENDPIKVKDLINQLKEEVAREDMQNFNIIKNYIMLLIINDILDIQLQTSDPRNKAIIGFLKAKKQTYITANIEAAIYYVLSRNGDIENLSSHMSSLDRFKVLSYYIAINNSSLTTTEKNQLITAARAVTVKYNELRNNNKVEFVPTSVDL